MHFQARVADLNGMDIFFEDFFFPFKIDETINLGTKTPFMYAFDNRQLGELMVKWIYENDRINDHGAKFFGK